MKKIFIFIYIILLIGCASVSGNIPNGVKNKDVYIEIRHEYSKWALENTPYKDYSSVVNAVNIKTSANVMTGLGNSLSAGAYGGSGGKYGAINNQQIDWNDTNQLKSVLNSISDDAKLIYDKYLQNNRNLNPNDFVHYVIKNGLWNYIEEEIFIESLNQLLKYSLSNDISDIEGAIKNRLNIKINLSETNWRLNTQLSEDVKNIMNKNNTIYSMTTYIEGKTRYVIINRQSGNNYYFSLYTMNLYN